MTLSIEDIPSTVTPRCRLIKFDKDILAKALLAQCQADGMRISEDCKLSVFGLLASTTVTLCIEGD